MNNPLSKINSYKKELYKNKEARDYLRTRGFEDIDFLIEEFSVGCCSDSGDFYCGYITFPIFDLDNNPVYMTGRNFKNLEPSHKHIGSSINYFFNHNDIFYEDDLILVEGCLDALSLLYIGLPSIGILGVNNLPENYIDLKDKNIIILFDSDKNEAGRIGAEKIADMLYSTITRSVKIAKIPRHNKDKMDVNMLFSADKTKDKTEFEDKIYRILDNAKEHVFVSRPPTIKKKTHRTYTDNWKNDYDIVKIINDYVSLESEGNLLRGFCPFHNESNSPSFTVYEDTQSFYCWGAGCGVGGTIIDFLILQYDFSFKKALEFLRINY